MRLRTDVDVLGVRALLSHSVHLSPSLSPSLFLCVHAFARVYVSCVYMCGMYGVCVC